MNFLIEIENRTVEHVKDISSYNRNFYKMNSSKIEHITHFKEICHEDENYSDYHFGYFFFDDFIEIFSGEGVIFEPSDYCGVKTEVRINETQFNSIITGYER